VGAAAPQEFVLQYDAQLRGLNVFRAHVFRETAHGRLLAVEATVKLGAALDDRAHVWLAFRAFEYSRETPVDRMMPALARVGAGDGSTWRVESWDWSKRHALPRCSFLLVGAPGEWPRSLVS